MNINIINIIDLLITPDHLITDDKIGEFAIVSKLKLVKLFNNCLFAACRHRSVKFVDFLNKKSNDMWYKKFKIPCYNKYKYMLANASENGNLEVVKYIVRIRPKYEFYYDNLYCVQKAAEHGHLNVFKYMYNKSYAFHLHNACKGGNMEIINLVLENEATGRFSVAVSGACEGGHLDIVKMFETKCNHFNSNTLIGRAVKSKNKELIQYILAKGVRNYQYAIKSACEIGDFETFEKFIDYYNGSLSKFLIYAYIGRNKNIINYILSKCPEQPLVEKMYFAFLSGDLEELGKLIELNSYTTNLVFIMTKACKANDIDTIKLILEKSGKKFQLEYIPEQHIHLEIIELLEN